MSLPVPPTATDFWNLFSVFAIIGLVAGGIVVGAMVYYAYINCKTITRREFTVYTFKRQYVLFDQFAFNTLIY